jgi:hypothetical protein
VETNLAPTYQFLVDVAATPNVLADVVAMPQLLTYRSAPTPTLPHRWRFVRARLALMPTSWSSKPS